MPNSTISPCNSCENRHVLQKMVGPANVGKITICGTETMGLIDTGLMVMSISKSFYKSMNPVPEFGDKLEMCPQYTDAPAWCLEKDNALKS
ncbi:MAG: hypothetical protein AB2693_35110 [Candidatus Thiodiazotropha sp.]